MGDEEKLAELEDDMLKAGMEEEKAEKPVSLDVPTVPKPKGWADADVLSQLRGAVRFLASKFGDQAIKEVKELFPALGD